MTSSQNLPAPATTTRAIKLANGTVIPANTDTTAQLSVGNKALVVIYYAGRAYLVPTTAVRFL